MGKQLKIRAIEHMPLMKKLLFANIISIFIAVIAIYMGALFAFIYKLDFFNFTASQDFLTFVSVLVLLFVFWKMLYSSIDKKELQEYKEREKKGKRRKKKVRKETYKNDDTHKVLGTWTCPQCGKMASNSVCKHCGYRISD